VAFYQNQIVPLLINWAMRQRNFAAYRNRIIPVAGRWNIRPRSSLTGGAGRAPQPLTLNHPASNPGCKTAGVPGFLVACAIPPAASPRWPLITNEGQLGLCEQTGETEDAP
jgi:hypothetical protein